VTLAHAAELLGIELEVVVGVDDLVRAAQGQPVGGDEGGHPVGLQDARSLGQRALRVGHVLDRLHRDDRREARALERQRAHVGHHRLAGLAGQRAGIDVHADGLAGGETAVAVAHPAPQVEHLSRTQEGLALLVCGNVALPGGVEPAHRTDHPLARDLRDGNHLGTA
jgi:hypothetical protein